MRILVTGASGFVGTHLVSELPKISDHIRVFVRESSNISHLNRSNCEIYFGDITNRKSVLQALKNVDKVIHLASSDKLNAREINVKGTKHILEGCAVNNIKQLIHCSTTGFLRCDDGSPINENSPIEATSLYERTKYEAEQLVIAHNNKYDTKITILRPTSIFGPHDTKHFLKLFKQVKKGYFPIIGSGENYKDLLYIKDLIRAFKLVLLKENNAGLVYNITGESPLTLNQLIDEVADRLSVKVRKLYLPLFPFTIIVKFNERSNDPFRIGRMFNRGTLNFYIKNKLFISSKAFEELRYKPQSTFSEALEETIIWYRDKNLI